MTLEKRSEVYKGMSHEVSWSCVFQAKRIASANVQVSLAFWRKSKEASMAIE